jgi:hypothetical protein
MYIEGSKAFVKDYIQCLLLFTPLHNNIVCHFKNEYFVTIKK